MTITVRSGFWNNTYSFQKGKSPLTRQIKRLMRTSGLGALQEINQTLLGVDIAGVPTAASARTMVKENGGTSGSVTSVGELGGKRLTTTRSLINRATAAADVTYWNNLCKVSFGIQSYPRDLSGNGGRAFTVTHRTGY